jgi:sensor histidine kinase regulating citrate/malate metabolism
VINSLAADYALRCVEMEIKLDVSINIPKDFSVPNYEMCIVLGNLLENAVEACQNWKKRLTGCL